MLVILKDVVKELLGACVVLFEGLAMISLPELIFFRESCLNFPFRHRIMDYISGTTLITSVLTHDFSHQLFDDGLERSFRRRFETKVSQVGGLQASIQRTGEILLRRRHLRLSKLTSEECIVVEGLVLAMIGQVSIEPI